MIHIGVRRQSSIAAQNWDLECLFDKRCLGNDQDVIAFAKRVKSMHDKFVVTLADLGSACLADPSQRAKVGVKYIHKNGYEKQALWYRSPEICLGDDQHSSAIDMWSVGCVVAEMLISRPLFPSADVQSHLKRIFYVFGTPRPKSRLRTLPLWRMATPPAEPLNDGLPCSGVIDACPELLSLMRGMFMLDPASRTKSRSALASTYFADVQMASVEGGGMRGCLETCIVLWLQHASAAKAKATVPLGTETSRNNFPRVHAFWDAFRCANKSVFMELWTCVPLLGFAVGEIGARLGEYTEVRCLAGAQGQGEPTESCMG